jgi:hypothetical protein
MIEFRGDLKDQDWDVRLDELGEMTITCNGEKYLRLELPDTKLVHLRVTATAAIRRRSEVGA